MGSQRSRPRADTAAKTGEDAPANESRSMRQRGIRGPDGAGPEGGADAEGATGRGGVGRAGGAAVVGDAGSLTAVESAGRAAARVDSPSQWGVF